MKYTVYLLCFLLPFVLSANNSVNSLDSVFKELKFGRKAMVIAVGSGAIKRHSLNDNASQMTEFLRTPFFSFSLDRCIHPTASNAYLGIGPFVTANMSKQIRESGESSIGKTYLQLLTAVKLTHHSTFFVNKHWDVCSSYYIGLHSLTSFLSDKNSELSNVKNTAFSPAIGIGLTMRYYFSGKTGIYAETALGYKINLLNFGVCYKIN